MKDMLMMVRHEGVSKWHSHLRRQPCCTNDGGRSAEIAIQVEISNYLKVLWSKAMVLSVKEKAVLNCQVRIKEMNEQVNHLRKCRKRRDSIKTRG